MTNDPETSAGETPSEERLLGQIADDFTRRQKNGEQPRIDEYRARHPEIAGLIGEVLPLLVALQGQESTVDGGTNRGTVDLPDPSTFAGYEILEELGRGGMGVVWKARQRLANRIVALKMILAGSYADSVDVARFRTEMETIARLSHPGIIRIFEVGEHQGRAFFSQEYCPGGSLDRRLAGTPMEPRDAVNHVRQLAAAIQVAHAAEIVHRDLKPANVLIDADGLLKIADFGLAKRLDVSGNTASGAIVGTPSYMSPEQARGEKVGTAADIYSLGAIFYECLTGRPPFRAASAVDTLLQIVDNDPIPPRQLIPNLPRDLEIICLKCLHKTPTQRYATARDLEQDLTRWLGGESIAARPSGSVERTIKWCRRKPALAGLLAALSVVVPVAFGVILWFYMKAVRQSDVARIQTSLAQTEEKNARNAEAAAVEAATTAERERAMAQALRLEAERQLERAEFGLYANQLQLALRDYKAGDSVGARSHLNRCRWDLRGIEYQLMAGLLNPKPIASFPFSSSILAGSRNGKWILSGGRDQYRLIESEAAGESRTFRGKYGYISEAAVSDDRTKIVVQSFVNQTDPKKILVVDGTTGTLLRTLDGEVTRGSGMTMNATGTLLAYSDGLNIRVCDVNTGNVRHTLMGHTNFLRDIEMNADGTRIASFAQDETLKLWDTGTGKCLSSLPIVISPNSSPNSSGGGESQPRAFAIDWQANRAVVGYADGQLSVWDLATRKVLFSRSGHTGMIGKVHVSVDGSRIVSLDPGTLKVRDARTGEELLTRSIAQVSPRCLAFSADASRIFLGRSGHFEVWDGSRPEGRESLAGHSQEVYSVAASRDGMFCASGSSDGTIRIWNPQTLKEVKRLGVNLFRLTGVKIDGVTAIAISPDDTRIASVHSDCTLRIWDVPSGKVLKTVRQSHSKTALCVAFSPDGTRLVTGGGDSTSGNLVLWDPLTGDRILSMDEAPKSDGLLNSAAISCVAFTPDGTQIVHGCRDKAIRVREATTGKVLRTLNGNSARALCLAVSRDGKLLLSGSKDRILKTWDLATGSEGLTLSGHAGEIRTVAFSPDGRRLLSGSLDSKIVVWDARDGRELFSVTGHSGGILSMAISGVPPDSPGGGEFLVSSGIDRKVRIWNLAGDNDRRTILAGTSIVGAGFVPSPTPTADGDRPRFITVSSNSGCRQWDTKTGREVSHFPLVQSTVTAATVSSDGTSLFSGHANKQVISWDPQTGKRNRILKGHTGAVTDLFWSPERGRLFSASADQTIRIWDPKSPEPLQTIPVSRPVERFAVAQRAQLVAILGKNDRSPTVYHETTGERFTLNGHTDTVTGLAFGPDETRIATASLDGTIRIWNANDGTPEKTLKHAEPIRYFVWLKKGNRLLAADGVNLIVWDVSTGQVVWKREHHSTPSRLIVDTDERQVAVFSGNGANFLRLERDP
jgi:eukaryotic-like serine/threonine-protein kinase